MRNQQDYDRLLDEYKKLEAENKRLEDVMNIVKADSDRNLRLVKKLKVYRSNWDKVKDFRKQLLTTNVGDHRLISLGHYMNELERRMYMKEDPRKRSDSE